MYYGIDAGVVHAGGRQVANLATEVEVCRATLISAVEAVAVGVRHDVQGTLAPGLEEFREWATRQAGAVSTGVSNLGNNTASGAVTSVDTTNECTVLSNHNAGQADDLRDVLLRPLCSP